jgi:hypothetical protein
MHRGVAQLGSAPLWGSGGRGFKSRRSDFVKTRSLRGFSLLLQAFSALLYPARPPIFWVIFGQFG